ncbi:MAG: hypothetical protein V1905_03535 [bacterium]
MANGLAKNVREESPGGISFDLTEQAKPYIIKESEYENTNLKDLTVLLGEVVNVEVTGLTKPADDITGQKVIYADYKAKFEPTPIGKIPFIFYDDGWRIEQ